MQKIKVLKNLTLFPEDKIINAMHRLNTGDFQFQLIVNSEGKLLGTLTDGDIRRAIMKGFTAESAVINCMNKSPKIGRISSPRKHFKLFSALPSILKFLPVVDKNDILKFVIVKKHIINNKTALIMAGGLGKRLGNKTKNIPKPLLKIGKESNFPSFPYSTVFLDYPSCCS